MEFVEDLEQLESMFEEHKLDNHDIQDFRQNVDECIARQVKYSNMQIILCVDIERHPIG